MLLHFFTIVYIEQMHESMNNTVTHSNTVFIKECDKRTNSKEQNKKPNRI